MELDKLTQLAEFHQLLVAPDINNVARRLAPALERYCEWELRSDGTRIDLVTLTEDHSTVGEFLATLSARGSREDQLNSLKALARFGAGAVVGMKLPIAGRCEGGELYVRAALPVQEVGPFLERQGVGSDATVRMAAIGQSLDKGYLHMLAADAGAAPRYTYFFTTYLEPGQQAAEETSLADALGLVGLENKAVDETLQLHRMLAANRPETLFFSSTIASGEPESRAKLDYSSVRLGLVAEAIALIGDEAGAGFPVRVRMLISWLMKSSCQPLRLVANFVRQRPRIG